jgi:hypothetical protein
MGTWTSWKSPGTIARTSAPSGSDLSDWDISVSPTYYCYGWNVGASSSGQLRFRNFGFSSTDIPVGKVIKGIEVRFGRRGSTDTKLYDDEVGITFNGTSIVSGSDDKASSTKYPDSAYETWTYPSSGGSSDDWNTDVERSDIVGETGFGFIIRCRTESKTGNTICYVDTSTAEIRIYHDDPVDAETHYYDGSSWQDIQEIHYYDGSTWQNIQEVYYYDGSNWKRTF